MANIRRSVLCSCGGDIYESTYERNKAGSFVAVWRCCNCNTVTTRQSRYRRTNRQLAIDAYLKAREAWKPVDEELDALVKSGKAMGGALLVHSSVFNYHLKTLINKDKPSNFDVAYHAKGAADDMRKAMEFIASKK